MARKLRSIVPGTIYHLITRFVAGEWFIETEKERSAYLDLLGRSLTTSDWRCLSFAVMSNHVHLGMVAGDAPLGSWLRNVHGPFAEWINGRRSRIGAVFVRGPKLLAVRPDGVARLIAYIHRNPVRAGVCAGASDTGWTSHRAYVGLASQPPWLDVETGLELAGFGSGSELDAWVQANAIDRAELNKALVPADTGGIQACENTGGYFGVRRSNVSASVQRSCSPSNA